MVDRALVADLGDEQLHLEAALAAEVIAYIMASSGTKYGLVMMTFSWRRVDSERNSRRLFSPSYAGPLGTTWQTSASGDVVGGHRGGGHVLVVAEQLVGLDVPVGQEHRVDRGHGRPGRAGS